MDIKWTAEITATVVGEAAVAVEVAIMQAGPRIILVQTHSFPTYHHPRRPPHQQQQLARVGVQNAAKVGNDDLVFFFIYFQSSFPLFEVRKKSY